MENTKLEFEELLNNNPYLKKRYEDNITYGSNLKNLISEMNKELGVTIINSVGHDEMFDLKVVEFKDEDGVVFFKCAPCSLWDDIKDWEEQMIFKAACRYKEIYLNKTENNG